MAESLLHVAVAVIRRDNLILLSKRAENVDQAGLWEFPGGKVESGETVEQALGRELEEELGIRPSRMSPLIQIPHRYERYGVLLDVWEVEAFHGEPHGREGQPIRWVGSQQLDEYDFPAANRPIIQACRLPRCVLITPEPDTLARFMSALEASLQSGIKLLQLRARSLAETEYLALAQEVLDMARPYAARVMLNGHWRLLEHLPEAGGIHVPGPYLQELHQRPVDTDYWFSMPCHDAGELQLAARLGADFALLSPVLPTASHPGAPALGWPQVETLLREAVVPVFALGGMSINDVDRARAAGAQGIAAIRGLWEE